MGRKFNVSHNLVIFNLWYILREFTSLDDNEVTEIVWVIFFSFLFLIMAPFLRLGFNCKAPEPLRGGRNSWYSFDRPRKDERLSQLWSHLVVLNLVTLDWEYSAWTTTLDSSNVKQSYKKFLNFDLAPGIMNNWLLIGAKNGDLINRRMTHERLRFRKYA